MKKCISLMFVFVLLLSLCACGGKTAVEETKATEAAKAPEVEQVSSEATVEMETEPEVETENAAFDNSWATNEFELQLAEPEFETWEVRGFTEGESWSMFVTEVTYGYVKSYASELRSYGFNLNEEEQDNYGGLAYVFKAENANGYCAELCFEAVFSDTLKGSFSLKISK